MSPPNSLIARVDHAAADWSRERGYHPFWKRRAQTRTKFSIIVPCYNVAPYVDQFMASWLSQSIDPKVLEIILVDDGSKDSTPEKLARWQRRFPQRIRIVTQKNGGISAARNAGLQFATGDWVSFPDPDDFVAPNYLAAVAREADGANADSLALIRTNFISYEEATGSVVDQQTVLRSMRGKRAQFDRDDPAMPIQQYSNCIWFRRDDIERIGLRFDGRVVPTFEDTHFLNIYLHFAQRRKVAITRHAVYFYRKRASQDSQVDRSKSSPAAFIDKFKFGFLGLLGSTSDKGAAAPAFVQRAVILSLLAHIRPRYDDSSVDDLLSPALMATHKDLIRRVLRTLSPDVLRSFPKELIGESERAGLAGLMGTPEQFQCAFIDDWDRRSSQLRVTLWQSSECRHIVARVNGAEVKVLHRKAWQRHYLGDLFSVSTQFWVEAPSRGSLEIDVDGAAWPLRIGNVDLGTPANLEAVYKKIEGRTTRPAPPAVANAGLDGCWLFMDRDSIADDNAEHLYRHLLKHAPGSNIFFALRKSSADWKRLEGEGFRLIPFGSKQHCMALKWASALISSHTDSYIFAPAGVRIRPVRKRRFIFLDHGVITQDCSEWLNRMPFDIFLTTTPDEYRSIAGPGSPYKFSTKQVKLTGLPRHDRLVSLPRSRKTILIAPTWRSYLVGRGLAGTFERAKFTGFEASGYLHAWRDLLNSPKLHALAAKHGLDVVFRPHPNMVSNVSYFVAHPNIRVSLPSEATSIQLRFAEAAALITDFSSVFMDMAVIDKPVIHYHFDAGEALAGKHLYRSGYFDFGRDGFGPVCQDLEGVLAALEKVLAGEEDPVYDQRRRATFTHRDGKSCERVIAEIEALVGPAPLTATAEPRA